MLRVELVTLSECKTGINEHQPGDELIGLTRALLDAAPGYRQSVADQRSVYLSAGAALLSAVAGRGRTACDQSASPAAHQFDDDCAHHQRILEQGLADEHERALAFSLECAYAQSVAGDLPRPAEQKSLSERA